MYLVPDSFTLYIQFLVSFSIAFAEPNECIPETSIKEYHPFQLKSSKLNSLVSKSVDGDLVVAGINGDKHLQQLELCIVSTDFGCDKYIPSNCIYQNVDYRFRVNRPIQGYLRVSESAVHIVGSFQNASPLNLYKEGGWGLRIAQRQHDGSRLVFSTDGGGKPITLVKPIKNDAQQWFQIIESARYRQQQ